MYDFFFVDLGFFMLRFVIGVIFIFQGISKIAGKSNPFPKKSKYLAIFLGLSELILGLLLLTGLWIKIVAILLAVIMLGAMYFHILKWNDKFKGGWDIAFLLFIILIFLALAGGGNWRIVF